MFTIKIAKKNQIFTHLPGKTFVIFYTSWSVKVFPCRLVFCDLLSDKTVIVDLQLKGPMKNFTVLQNMEKNRLEIFAISAHGYFKYYIEATNDQVYIHFIKAPKEGILCQIQDTDKCFFPNDTYTVLQAKTFPSTGVEKLSLGVHKQQQIEKIQERKNLLEILPLWFEIAQKMPKLEEQTVGCLSLLAACQNLIQNKEKQNIFPNLLSAYQACFYDGFVPRLFDEDYQGICQQQERKKNAPVHLVFSCGYQLIRSLFVQEKKQEIFLLPCLPVQCHCGRMLNVQCEDLGNLDMEWSKKMMKKMIFRPRASAKILFRFPTKVKRFRIRCHRKEKGTWIKANASMQIDPEKTYFFDRFQK